MRVFQVGVKGFNSCIFEDYGEAAEEIKNSLREDAAVGDIIIIKVLDMSQQELDELEEFTGP